MPGCGPTLSISDSPAVLAGFSAHPQDVSWLCAVSRALSQCCVSERNSAVPALMSSYRPPRPLHTRGASSAPGNPGAGLDGRLSPSACLGEVGHSGHGSGIFCPILGPAQGVEGQGLPEVSVALARPGRDHQGCRLHPTSCHRQLHSPRREDPLLEKWPGGWLLSLIWSLSSGHPAQAEWQVPEQGVEEEVCDTLRQRAAHLPPQPARESGRPALGEAGAGGQGQRGAAWLRDLSEFKWTLP